jgi:subtilase-type serine protease
VKAGDAFRYDGSPSVGSDGKLGAHGTHVGGIAAGSRDGGPMHGVAFGAQIISADNGDPARKTASSAATTARCTRPAGMR